MKLNKYSMRADGIADLYRSALYLARGADEVGLDFLRKAREKLEEKLVEPPGKLKTHQQQLFWAERILDQYKKLKLLLG